MENNTKIMTVVYADNIGLVLQGGVTEIIIMQDTGHDDGDTILRTEGGKNIFVHTNGLRTITGCCKLFITVQRTENMTDTYAVDPYEEISFCDGKMYFTDVFSGENMAIEISTLKSIATSLVTKRELYINE